MFFLRIVRGQPGGTTRKSREEANGGQARAVSSQKIEPRFEATAGGSEEERRKGEFRVASIGAADPPCFEQFEK